MVTPCKLTALLRFEILVSIILCVANLIRFGDTEFVLLATMLLDVYVMWILSNILNKYVFLGFEVLLFVIISRANVIRFGNNGFVLLATIVPHVYVTWILSMILNKCRMWMCFFLFALGCIPVAVTSDETWLFLFCKATPHEFFFVFLAKQTSEILLLKSLFGLVVLFAP